MQPDYLSAGNALISVNRFRISMYGSGVMICRNIFPVEASLNYGKDRTLKVQTNHPTHEFPHLAAKAGRQYDSTCGIEL